MAVAIALQVSGGIASDSVTLTSSGVTVTSYPMQSPDKDQQVIAGAGESSSLGIPSWRNVTETIELTIKLSTPALVAEKIQDIERLLDLTRQGSLGMHDGRLYLHVLFDQDSEVWRSEILSARLDIGGGTNQIWRKFVSATLIITRRFYWETVDLHNVEVSSGTTTSATTGYAAVYNNDDAHATQRNWFQIAAAQVTGTIPAPAKIYVKNTSGATRGFSTIYLGNYVHCNPTAVDPIRIGSAADVIDTTPGATSPTGTVSYAWSLASGTLTNPFHGQYGRAVVVWSDRPAVTTIMRFSMLYRFPAPEFDLALGEQVMNTSGDYVTDLGALPIPPGGNLYDSGTNLYLAVRAKAASGTDTLGIDWVQIFPTGNGRFRVVNAIAQSMNMGSNDEFIDDGPSGLTYYSDGGTYLPIFRPLHTPIYLWPDKVQRLRMIISGGAIMEPGEVWGVKVQYRPRRLSF